MSTIALAMAGDHGRCDEYLNEIEEAAGAADWARATAALERFGESLRRHLDAEEQGLFPLLEEEPGVPPGPLQVMVMEHGELRATADELAAGVAARDSARVLEHVEPLLILLQQHNVKEEEILYPMADEMLSPDRHARALAALAEWGIPVA